MVAVQLIFKILLQIPAIKLSFDHFFDYLKKIIALEKLILNYKF